MSLIRCFQLNTRITLQGILVQLNILILLTSTASLNDNIFLSLLNTMPASIFGSIISMADIASNRPNLKWTVFAMYFTWPLTQTRNEVGKNLLSQNKRRLKNLSYPPPPFILTSFWINMMKTFEYQFSE